MRNIKILGFVALAGLVPLGAFADNATCSAHHETAWTGTLTAVNADNHTITAKTWWHSETFNVATPCAISTPDKPSAALGDLRPGEKVRVCYMTQAGVRIANRIGVVPFHLTGTIKSVDQKDRTLTVEETFAPRSFRLASDCHIVLWNDKEGTPADLMPGNIVRLTYELPRGAAVAYRIREESQTYSGKVNAIDLRERTVKAGDQRFDLGDNCHIMLNGKPNAQLSDLKLNQKYLFTFEEVDGVNVVSRIAPSAEAQPVHTASTR